MNAAQQESSSPNLLQTETEPIRSGREIEFGEGGPEHSFSVFSLWRWRHFVLMWTWRIQTNTHVGFVGAVHVDEVKHVQSSKSVRLVCLNLTDWKIKLWCDEHPDLMRADGPPDPSVWWVQYLFVGDRISYDLCSCLLLPRGGESPHVLSSSRSTDPTYLLQ